jgi:DNA repair protein RadA
MKGNDGLHVSFRTAEEAMQMRQQVSTGIKALDDLLEGGFETGLLHLMYGGSVVGEDLLKIAVHTQAPKEMGGLNTPIIIIDNANIIKLNRLTLWADEYGLDPEEVLDRIYISRAFNASQTYDLIMNQLDDFLKTVSARVLIVSGLPDLYIKEGDSPKSYQEITHMATKLMTTALRSNLVAIVSTHPSQRNPNFPAGGKALSSYAQVHIKLEETKTYLKYVLAKHPHFPVKTSSRTKPVTFGTTLPLSYFLNPQGED